MHTLSVMEPMTPREVYKSAERGKTIAKQLRDGNAEQRFRYPHAIFLIAMKQGYRTAAETALELANGTFTMDEAMRYVRRVFELGKLEIKERNI